MLCENCYNQLVLAHNEKEAKLKEIKMENDRKRNVYIEHIRNAFLLDSEILDYSYENTIDELLDAEELKHFKYIISLNDKTAYFANVLDRSNHYSSQNDKVWETLNNLSDLGLIRIKRAPNNKIMDIIFNHKFYSKYEIDKPIDQEKPSEKYILKEIDHIGKHITLISEILDNVFEGEDIFTVKERLHFHLSESAKHLPSDHGFSITAITNSWIKESSFDKSSVEGKGK